MSEEEIIKEGKIINRLNTLLNSNVVIADNMKVNKNIFKDAINLIEKNKKEIEKLNSEFAINIEIHKRDMKIKELEEANNCLHETNNDFISKDKIRDKILELNGIKGELEEKDFGIGFTLDDYYKEITIKIKSYKELLEE